MIFVFAHPTSKIFEIFWIFLKKRQFGYRTEKGTGLTCVSTCSHHHIFLLLLIYSIMVRITRASFSSLHVRRQTSCCRLVLPGRPRSDPAGLTSAAASMLRSSFPDFSLCSASNSFSGLYRTCPGLALWTWPGSFSRKTLLPGNHPGPALQQPAIFCRWYP